ncbi:hypothetical protein CPEBRM1_ABPJDJAI_00904 [Companilactobacillus paralimentarius]|uniref:hypothetical protein n=1 Tax=Companilactobacillus paralimentarius TaxID=83526 RepID=UPI003851600D
MTKKLDVQKITTVGTDEAIDKYQGQLLQYIHQDILLSAQNEKMQKIIEEVFKKAPEAFPADFVMEEK